MEIQCRDVRKRYDSGFELEVRHLDVTAGERVGVVGNNGAGKTTLLHLLLGLRSMQRGAILLDGESVGTFSLSWRSRTSSYLGESCLLPYLNPWEFWQFVGDAYGLKRTERIRRLREYESFVELAVGRGRDKKYLRDYSQGNRKKIGLVAAMMVRPRLLVLDEPFTSLDPRSRSALEDGLLALNAEHGTTLFISSNDLAPVVQVSGRMLMIDRGRIVHDGASGPATLRFMRERLTGRQSRSTD